MKLNHSTKFDQSNLMPEAVLCSRKSVFFFLSVSVLYLAQRTEETSSHLTVKITIDVSTTEGLTGLQSFQDLFL